MNLYRLELKRVCKTRMTAILLAIALVLAVVMAYLPVTFIGWTGSMMQAPSTISRSRYFIKNLPGISLL